MKKKRKEGVHSKNYSEQEKNLPGWNDEEEEKCKDSKQKQMMKILMIVAAVLYQTNSKTGRQFSRSYRILSALVFGGGFALAKEEKRLKKRVVLFVGLRRKSETRQNDSMSHYY